MKNKAKNPKVILVGSGPGDAELITVKGLNAIKSADVILYDALVNKELLKNAKKSTECIYVGKRFNQHKYPQEVINQMLVDNAFKYGTVVRLKGGDPFVFGRGSEEIEYVENQGVEVEFIPGISSALAVPSSQGIPLTKRGLNESFWVITGTRSDGQISKDIINGAQSSATLVILMGLRNFSIIMSEVIKYRHKYTPFAIIQNGTLPDEKITIETLSNYKNVIDTIDYSSPGIIIIGDVVGEHPSFLEEEIQRVLEVII
ncbi:uroporphyrinogen-III C-methyltransferase [Urechidicola croceus]|uniref:uroporphyrinogen-III C-methyltransferase n=1 Tax=Urechidicola croceus TaxID=1850246 RepID=A0A1D8P722_9FLAO|nr:uroporphyrinogen-III C-methyltransferase [Urechidicola croceus]AOW20359.1 uroporphyrinogen-III C-methyltransferase [Urechidicola croceus]